MIIYDPLWETMKRKKVTGYALVYKLGIPSATLQRLKNGLSVTINTIDDLCEALDCKPKDILDYVPNKKGEPQ